MQKVYGSKKAEEFLKRYIPVAKSIVAKKYSDAEAFSKKAGFPVVLKILSEQALHKSDIEGVLIAHNSDELSLHFDALMKTAKKRRMKLDGIMVQEFVQGHELIIGIKKDNTFGHVLMVGAGGIYTEILKDVAFRACPITPEDADSMLNELKTIKLLQGVRGQKPAHVALLKKVMVKVSAIPVKNRKITELDINPFIINDKTGKAADARIVFA
jgi:acyl-CoA synthetase (NDP forming)